MAQTRLKEVRKDTNVAVYTEHPDRIHPRDLSNSLSSQCGENRFKIYLRRNIYIVYIYSWRPDDFGSEALPLNREQNPVLEDYKQRLEDVREAEKVLRNARLCKV